MVSLDWVDILFLLMFQNNQRIVAAMSQKARFFAELCGYSVQYFYDTLNRLVIPISSAELFPLDIFLHFIRHRIESFFPRNPFEVNRNTATI